MKPILIAGLIITWGITIGITFFINKILFSILVIGEIIGALNRYSFYESHSVRERAKRFLLFALSVLSIILIP